MSNEPRTESTKVICDSAGNKLWREISPVETRYCAKCPDAAGGEQTVTLTRTLYLEMLNLAREERADLRKRKRHEETGLTEEELYERAANKPRSVEDAVIENMRGERFRQVLLELPEIQRRRFLLYYESKLTYEQIAKVERCKRQSATESVLRAKAQIIDAIKNS